MISALDHIEPERPPLHQPDANFKRKRSRSPSGDAMNTRAKRPRRTRKCETGAATPSQPVGSPPGEEPEVSGPAPQKYTRQAKRNSCAPFSERSPGVRGMMNTLATNIEESGFAQGHGLEPCLGDARANTLMSFRPEADWVGYGKKGESVLTLMVDMSENGGFACMWCEHRPQKPKWKRTVAHIRETHFHFRPFPCDKVHRASW